MPYQPLPIVSVSIDKLQLDLENYRIPTRRDDQDAALAYLFSAEDVLGQARQIIRSGYFDNEVPIVVSEGGAYVVLEGNRRVSALKALHNPSLVPAYESEVRALLKRYAVEAENLPTQIRVIVATDRATAAPRIARLHTGLAKRPWSRDQQATFYYSLLNSHTSVTDVKGMYPDVEVVRLMKMAVVRRFLAGVRFRDKSLHEYVTGPGLMMSAFEYAYRRKPIATAVGLSFESDGQLSPAGVNPEKAGSGLKGAQREALEYLMVEFRSGRLTTRSPGLKNGTTEYANLLLKLAGDPSKPSEDDSPETGDDEIDVDERSDEDAAEKAADKHSDDEVVGSDGGESGAGDDSGTRGPNHPDTKDSLQLSGVDYTTHAPVGLQKRYHELRSLSVTKYPAATTMLLRSILETTIKHHFESTPTPATGELTAVVGVMAAAYGGDKQLRLQVGKIRSGGAAVPGSVQWFNVISHSADATVTPADVRAAWDLVNPVLRRLLRPA